MLLSCFTMVGGGNVTEEEPIIMVDATEDTILYKMDEITMGDVVLTKNTYSNTVLKESQMAAMNEFIDNIKILINALGYKVLEPMVIKDSASTADDEKLYMSTGTATAEDIEKAFDEVFGARAHGVCVDADGAGGRPSCRRICVPLTGLLL